MLDIIGSGLTAALYDWNSVAERWSTGSTFPSFGKKIDVYFCLHQGQDIEAENKILLDEFPIDDVIDYGERDYFTNSIAYMIVYAVMNGHKRIRLYGVDLEADGEYEFERPCVAYWIGWARAKGCNVYCASGIGESVFRYGYDRIEGLIDLIGKRELAYNEIAKRTEGDQRQQFIGAGFALKKLKLILRG